MDNEALTCVRILSFLSHIPTIILKFYEITVKGCHFIKELINITSFLLQRM